MAFKSLFALAAGALLFFSGSLISQNLPSSTAVATTQTTPNQPPRPALSSEMRADIFMARKMFREAVDMYKSVLPPNAMVANKLGIAYHQMQDIQLAKRHYEKAQKLNPKYSEAVNNLGTIYYAEKNYRRAIKQYKKALGISPKSASIHSNLGTAYFARKDYRRAIEHYQTALQLDPEVFERRGSNGVLLQDRSVHERAKYHFFLAKMYAENAAKAVGSEQASLIERSVMCIRKSLEEGFKDRQKFVTESAFEILKENVEYQQIMANAPRVL
jgi:tetratricopeptide (TPR) repeat protein